MTTTHAHDAGVDVPAALAWLANIGITTEVLATAEVDARDPTALGDEIERLLEAAVSNDAIVDADQLWQLGQAYRALYTDAEPALTDFLDQFVAVASRHTPNRGQMVSEAGRRRRYDVVNLPRYGGACLEVE